MWWSNLCLCFVLLNHRASRPGSCNHAGREEAEGSWCMWQTTCLVEINATGAMIHLSSHSGFGWRPFVCNSLSVDTTMTRVHRLKIPTCLLIKKTLGVGGGLLMGKVITALHRMGLAAAYRGHGEDKHVAVGVMAPTPGPLGSLEVLQLF